MAIEDVATNAGIKDNDAGTIKFDALGSQNGTLSTLSKDLDLCVYDGQLSGTALPSPISLANRLAILAITLKNSNGSNIITQSITGMTIRQGSNTYAVAPASGTFSENVLYVAIRPTNKADIEVTATGGTKNYTKSLTKKTYKASNGYNVNWRMAGAIKGKFTINQSNGQVYFSQGNLQATWNGSAWSWAFATNQSDYIGNAHGNTSINESGGLSSLGTVDLFGWSTENTYFGINNSTGEGDYGGDFKDWGENIGTGWRTLTSAEWSYLINHHNCTKGQRVNGNKGLVIYPDGYNGNEYQGNNWNEFETAGCIFLPVAFSRLGQTVYTGEEGSYWSSSPSEVTANSMHFIYLNDTWIVTSDNAVGRPSGVSVRLVRPVN